MIPRDYITEWRTHAPWIQDIQVEQDLVISRATVEIFQQPLLAQALAFRGGTALYKLYLKPAARYSEDIDLVQVRAEQAGPVMSLLRSVLDPWLGEPRWKQSEGRVTFVYRFASEDMPSLPLRLKVEINTREHFAVHGYTKIPYSVYSRWFEGSCQILTYEFDELLGTKLRALYQRRKGRDLFDITAALASGKVNPERVVHAFCAYMDHGGHHVFRDLFKRNLEDKLRDPLFTADIRPLLVSGHLWDIHEAVKLVIDSFVRIIPPV